MLSTAGIGIGVATLLAILGIIRGLDVAFTRQMASLGSTSLFISKQAWGGADWWEARNRKDFDFKQVAAIQELSTYAVAVAPYTSVTAEISVPSKRLLEVTVLAATEDYLQVSGYELASGRFLSRGDAESEASVVVLGADVAATLFPNANPLRGSVLVHERPFRVIGTLGRRGKILDSDFDRAVIIPYKTMLAYFGKKRPMRIIVGIDSAENVNAAEDQLIGILRRARGTPAGDPDDFVINRPEQLLELYKQLTGALYGVVIGIGLITLLVGGIGIMNIMLVTVRERTQEIGVRRALGARRRTIVLQFLIEAAVLSALGGGLGTAVGLGMANLIAAISPLPATVQPGTVVFGVGFAAAVGLLFGIWPAARAAHLDPIEALRHE